MTASISPASTACCSGPPLGSRSSTFYSQGKQHLRLVAEVAHEIRGRQRRELGEARRDENTLGHRAPRMLEDVDDFQLVAVLQVFLANRLEIGDGLQRIGRAARDVQAQHDDRRERRRARLGFAGRPPHFEAPLPLFLEECSAGSALRLLRSSFSLSLEDTLRTSSSPEYSANAARCLCRSNSRALIWALVVASANCSSRRLWSNSARCRVFLAPSSASFSQRSVPISTSPPAL